MQPLWGVKNRGRLAYMGSYGEDAGNTGTGRIVKRGRYVDFGSGDGLAVHNGGLRHQKAESASLDACNWRVFGRGGCFAVRK